MSKRERRNDVLETEQIAQLASTGDAQFHATRTAGLVPASLQERLAILIVLFVVGTALVIHFEYVPFLPISLSPNVEGLVSAAAFVAAVIGALGLLIILGALVLGRGMAAWEARFPKAASIRCPRCSKTSTMDAWSGAGNCPKCHSDVVYCAKCGKPASFAGFMAGTGCPHCGHLHVMTSPS